MLKRLQVLLLVAADTSRSRARLYAGNDGWSGTRAAELPGQCVPGRGCRGALVYALTIDPPATAQTATVIATTAAMTMLLPDLPKSVAAVAG